VRNTTTAAVLCLLLGVQACAAFSGGMFDKVQYLRDVRIVEVAPGQAGIIYALGRIVSEDRDGVRYDVYVQPFDVEQPGRVPTVGEVCTIAYAWTALKDDYTPMAPATSSVREKKVREGRSATCGAVTYSFPRLSED
jgi:hypothetical protein